MTLLGASMQQRALALAVHEVKKSRFVARAKCARSWEEASAFISEVSDAKARHNCYCWVGAQSARSSDDGEPSGTAGKPIREAIASAGASNVVVVVTRYKPSTAPRLGAGGLIRAYGAAAREALRECDLQDDRVSALAVRVPVGQLGSLRSWAHRWAPAIVERRGESYDATHATLALGLDPARIAEARRDAAAHFGDEALVVE